MRATAFGLDIDSPLVLSFLDESSAQPTGRTLALAACESGGAEDVWPRDAELVCDERGPGDAPNFRIESHPEMGYLITGPEYGSHLLSADGGRLRCYPEGQPEGAWQRMLVAQALPFAALLHGLEVFHASAVVRGGEAVAFLGPSHSGKTSLALELCGRGASFLADDVLAVEIRGGELLAHPGSHVAGVDRRHPARRSSVEEIVAVSSRERIVRVRGTNEPTPVTSMFFLDRRFDGPERPCFAPSADAQLLLAATFNFVLATPERLQRLLDVCALAARLRVERVVSGPGTGAAELAEAIERRLDAAR
jgi:hypothetical protein